MKAEAGQKVSVEFSIINDQTFGIICKHKLKKEGSRRIKAEYKILENAIVFEKVKLEDSGQYTISCKNSAGEGSASFDLHVTPTKGNMIDQYFYPIFFTIILVRFCNMKKKF